MAKQSNNGQEAPINGAIWIFMFVMTLLFGYMLWLVAHKEIATAYSWLRIVEFSPFLIFKSWWAGVPGAVLFCGGLVAYLLKAQKAWARRAMVVGGVLCMCGLVGWIFAGWFGFFWGSNKALIELSHIFQSTIVANAFTLLCIIIPIAILSFRKSLATNPLNERHYAKSKDYTLHSFTDEMGAHYPHLRLFRKLDLTKKPINEGKYRMPDTEKQIAIKKGLLDRVGEKRSEFIINRDRTAEVFREQMGPMWSGYNKLSKWELAIMAILLPRLAATDPKMSDADYKVALAKTDSLIRDFWENAADSYDGKRDAIALNLDDAAKTVRRYKNSPKVLRFFARHAYVNTIIYSMLQEARTLGVLAAADLRWLRVADRRLWLVVDNVGRITAFPEVSAIYSHYLHETKSKRAIERPMIDSAISSLVRAIDEVAFSEDEIVEINASMEAADKPVIDPTAKPEKKTVFLATRAVIDAPNARDIFDVALISQAGEIIYQTQCKPMLRAELIQAQFGLSNEAIDQLATMPTSDAARKKVLELVNGNEVVVFNVKRDGGDFPGMERSAKSIVPAMTEEGDFDLVGTAVEEGVVEPQDAQIDSAADAAVLVKLLWESERKKELQAKAEALKNGGAA